MAANRLATLFTSFAPPSWAARGGAEALERDLAARIDVAQAAWPGAPVDEASFLRYLARHSTSRLPPVERAADMWLACACANGASAAIAAFIDRYRGPIERAAARVEARVAEEAAQVVFTSLLVREGDERPRIEAYGGESSLSTWLATVSARAAIKLCRGCSERPHESVSELACAMPDESPELVFLRARFAPELEVALRAALGALDGRRRMLLRLHHADGWSLERLAGLYEISRATMARWLAAARQELYEGAKRHLRERLDVTSAEFESIAALVGVGLEVSVVRLLREEGGGEGGAPGRVGERESAQGESVPVVVQRSRAQ
ncbi:MAG TPA: sigma factor-like helix-turn-helix DNA-binding protein [Polyangiaceae bacterium]|jgi:RNA polymerase sigma-70 factor (ECF subfamily)